MYEQAVLSVEDPQRFGAVHAAIESSFSSSRVAGFMKSLQRHSLRIRDFETVLRRKMLGEPAIAEYEQLGNSDQGQIREFYLASLEQVDPELRQKFFKLYAYY
ncbi:hypothetical protein [Granulicella arctica]|uniref:hypothetical protein n=1 Tax=Granulicella arctica TaxID=940613 RepID=UPI0021DFEEBE|nr:hypothetical protein [Granulicella arctica]